MKTSLGLIQNDGTIKSFSQELRLSNDVAGRFRWVIGGNYENSHVDQFIENEFTDSSTHEGLNLAFRYTPSHVTYTSLQDMQNYALFANAEFDLLSTLTVKAGARYTEAKRDAQICSADTSNDPKGTGAFFYDILIGGAFGPYVPGDCYTVNDQAVAINGVTPGAPGEFTGKLNENNVSWRVGLDWKPKPGFLFYGNIAKGYKAGSFPSVSASSFCQYFSVKEESVLSVEGGF